jgi:hypothetical protein
MKGIQSLKVIGPVAALVTIVLVGILGSPLRVQAQDPSEVLLIQQGFQLAPVPLNLAGLDTNLVGLGSFLVNAVADCNGCHTGGGPPNFNYAAGGNPYFGQPKKTDPTVYLSGGSDFGPVAPPTGPNMYTGPDMIARNLTPDKTGLPEGGHTLSDFMQIMRTGIDFDHLHPNCTSLTPTPQPPNCIPSTPDNPVNGNLLQIMPWPVFQSMSDHYLQAIYAYLTAIPCISGPTDPNDPLHNDCGSPVITPPPPTATVAVANPKNVTVTTRQVQLDGTKSTSADGKPLTYLWTLPQGSLPAGIIQATTATPTVQFGRARGLYTFLLTVTDSTGKSATDTASVNFVGN